VRAAQEEKEKPKPKKVDSDTLRLQEELTEKIGAKVTINHQQNGKGKLVINYLSLDELEGIMRRIVGSGLNL